jgi:hypothetical protein
MSLPVETERLEITGLPPGTMRALAELARENDQTAEEYARMVLEAKFLAQSHFGRFSRQCGKAFRKRG